MNKICVYAICKNEAKFVERWVESMCEADYIVVLDTGSTDDTVEVLYDVFSNYDVQGTIVSKEINPWRFDTARNEALVLVPDDCNICVSTDLDEVFEPGWAKLLRDNWNDEIHERCDYTYIWKHNSDGSPNVTYRYNKIHSKNWIWRTPVHEYLTRKNDETNFTYTPNVALNLRDKIILHHYPDDSKSRGSYLNLLEIRAKEYPDDKVSMLYLAREYWFYRMYKEAINILIQITTVWAKDFEPIQVAYSYLLMGYCFGSMIATDADKHTDLACKAFETGISLYPWFMENYTGLAEIYLGKKKYITAKYIIEEGFYQSRRQYHWVEDGSNWTYKPLEILALANFELGNKKDAIAIATKAITYSDEKCLKDNLQLMLDMTSFSDIIK